MALDLAWGQRRYIDTIEQEAESEGLSFEETLQRVSKGFGTARQISALLRSSQKVLKKAGLPGGVSNPLAISREAALDRMNVRTRPMFAARRELLAGALEGSPAHDSLVDAMESRGAKVSRIELPAQDDGAEN